MHQKYLLSDPWKIIEDQWRPEKHQGSESIFSIGNGFMGQRANFEEDYSGPHLQGSYLGGVYYPDKTRVGWWKNGYPEYFAKVLNSVNWIGLRITIDGQVLDLAQVAVSDFYRELNMQEGYLLRRFSAEIAPGNKISVEAQRFVSMTRKEIGALRYRLRLENFSAQVEMTPYLDFDVINHDSNYEEKFWRPLREEADTQKALVAAQTKKLDFAVSAAMCYALYQGSEALALSPESATREKYAEQHLRFWAEAETDYELYKYAAVVSSFHHPEGDLDGIATAQATEALRVGFAALLAEQKADWQARWEQSDVLIEGDPEAQQGIRFNIFQLTQTYTGEDARLNIGPKGFTGEKYGGSTYWDTEAYCLPFYMATAGQEVARQLLIYRYKHLPKAIENAEKLGFSGGAALYPMVTMNGEECHNEWEITFEEIHRNGAIAYAIYNYLRHFDDPDYLGDYGLEVLIGIARFWAQRFNYSEAKGQYVMLGVTGPNEYENNVNNNWYTNYLARWCLRYTAASWQKLSQEQPAKAQALATKLPFDSAVEIAQWEKIASQVYLPEDPSQGIVLQQEGYLDKEQRLASDLALSERPINQHWSWDRILRSCYIKQADVLQGFYFFEEDFSLTELERNYDFYEPRTLHESSLSPCVHVVLAARLGKMEQAYALYLRTSRLDLDDYNREVHEGLHITSMAGTWLSVVEGFGGMQIKAGELHFAPQLPAGWSALRFQLHYRGRLLKAHFSADQQSLERLSGEPLELYLNGKRVVI